MRKRISYDKKYLSEVLNYSQVPVRQILALDLKPLSQLLLIQLFSHSDKWGISFNQTSKSFYRNKNRSDIKKCYEELKLKGYLMEKNDVYYVMLSKIQSDYQLFVEKSDSCATSDSNSNIDSGTISLDDSLTTSGVVVPLPVVDSSATSLDDSSTYTNNINEENKEKNRITKSRKTHIEDIGDDFKINDNSSQSNPENEYPTSIQVELTNPSKEKTIPTETVLTTSPQLPSFHFSPNEIHNQIEDYNFSESKYFQGNNQIIISNSFLEYYNQFPKSKLDIFKYEQVLYVQLLQTLMLYDGITLNEYLLKNPVRINPADTQNFVKMINNKSDVKEIFKKIIEKVNELTNVNN
ncbi:MAG: hypothetical protein JXB49_32200 [Bacteroidales bacterium]|nr:hypothetical protein [Bacteroidales bacterium]